MTDSFEMLRIYATPDSAKVIQFSARWKRANMQFVGNYVGRSATVAVKNQAVSARICCGHPNPTTAFAKLFDF
jgi:hypothetical protein